MLTASIMPYSQVTTIYGSLCEELGIDDKLRFHETGMGFFYKGKIHPMNNIIEFLRFPPLGWIDQIPPWNNSTLCSIHSRLAQT